MTDFQHRFQIKCRAGANQGQRQSHRRQEMAGLVKYGMQRYGQGFPHYGDHYRDNQRVFGHLFEHGQPRNLLARIERARQRNHRQHIVEKRHRARHHRAHGDAFGAISIGAKRQADDAGIGAVHALHKHATVAHLGDDFGRHPF